MSVAVNDTLAGPPQLEALALQLDEMRREMSELRAQQQQNNSGGGDAPRSAEVVVNPSAWVEEERKDAALEAFQNEYEFEGSVWDTTLLVGLPRVGAAGSGFLVVLLLMNVMIQAFFTYIVINSLSSPVITDGTVSEFRLWRTTVGHDIANFVSTATV